MAGQYTQETLKAHFDATNRRLAAIEEQVKRLSDASGITYSTFVEEHEVPEEVVQLAVAGDQLAAVKKLRELTGMEFEQARDIVVGL